MGTEFLSLHAVPTGVRSVPTSVLFVSGSASERILRGSSLWPPSSLLVIWERNIRLTDLAANRHCLSPEQLLIMSQIWELDRSPYSQKLGNENFAYGWASSPHQANVLAAVIPSLIIPVPPCVPSQTLAPLVSKPSPIIFM